MILNILIFCLYLFFGKSGTIHYPLNTVTLNLSALPPTPVHYSHFPADLISVST